MSAKPVTIDLPLQVRAMALGNADAEKRTVDIVWSTGSRVVRYDWLRDEQFIEELSLEPKHVRMERLRSGAPLLDSHMRHSLASQIGVVERAQVDGKQGTATVRFSKRAEVEPIFQDVIDGVIRNVSVGYRIHKVEKTRDEPSGLTVLRAIDWEPWEISFLPVGADAGAGVRSGEAQQKYPCEIVDRSADSATTVKELDMQEQTRAAQPAGAADTQSNPQAAAPAAPALDMRAETERAQRAERERVTQIRALCAAHHIERGVEDQYITDGTSLDAVRAAILEQLAERSRSQPIRSAVGHIEVVGDEGLQRRAFMVEALTHRLAPQTQLSEGARPYRHMSLLRMCEEVLTLEGVSVRGLSRLELATRAMMTTSDFPNILADVANKRLREAYEEHQPTYTRWARRAANAPDFKNINVMQLSATPALLAVPEHGEFKYGSVSDAKVTYAVTTYGRLISISRQSIVNDDVAALDRIPRAFSGSARRLENSTVYALLIGNGNMPDGVALFHANHGNLPAAAAISATSLQAARALMRAHTGLAGEKLNLAPRFLLAGIAKEQEAYQYTSAQYVPAKASDINEFRAGGRTAVEPIIDPEIDANKWFLAADPGQIDTIEYCYLNGSEGVYLESQVGFKIDGIEVKARLDFAAAVIDHRGLVYNSGL